MKIERCHSAGTLTVQAGNVGGLLGQVQNTSTTLSDCYSTADVSAAGVAGGLVARTTADLTATGCYATGSVSSTNVVGGLVGEFTKGSVTKSYATGAVTAINNHYAGGLIGKIKGNVTVSECYATGAVGDATQNRRGGLIGNVDSGTSSVSNCYTTSAIVSSAYSGCLIGGVESAATISVRNSYAKSTITGATWTACAFCSSYVADVTGFIAWNLSNRMGWCYGGSGMPEGNYMGKDGTISAKAKDFKWDENIWDLSGDDPKLKWTLPSNK